MTLFAQGPYLGTRTELRRTQPSLLKCPPAPDARVLHRGGGPRRPAQRCVDQKQSNGTNDGDSTEPLSLMLSRAGHGVGDDGAVELCLPAGPALELVGAGPDDLGALGVTERAVVLHLLLDVLLVVLLQEPRVCQQPASHPVHALPVGVLQVLRGSLVREVVPGELAPHKAKEPRTHEETGGHDDLDKMPWFPLCPSGNSKHRQAGVLAGA